MSESFISESKQKEGVENGRLMWNEYHNTSK
jgi:hypothetical protein